VTAKNPSQALKRPVIDRAFCIPGSSDRSAFLRDQSGRTKFDRLLLHAES